MIKRNIIISCAIALTITGAFGQTANATTNGWNQSNGGWYYYQNNSFKTGWIQDSSNWYYLNPSTGAMQTGWINDKGTWYYLDSSGVMLSSTTVGVYVLGANGACINPNAESTTAQSQTGTLEKGKSASEIKEIMKNKYGFIDYNDGLLLNPAGENRSHKGDYVNDQIATHEITDNKKVFILVKYDSETISIFKDILNMIFPNKADEAYSLLADFRQSGGSSKTYNFYGKTITIYGSADGHTTQWNISK